MNAAKAALEVALARATQQRSGYEPYREMAQFDHQLDLASLAPAYKATCARTAKAITGAAVCMRGRLASHSVRGLSHVGCGRRPCAFWSKICAHV